MWDKAFNFWAPFYFICVLFTFYWPIILSLSFCRVFSHHPKTKRPCASSSQLFPRFYSCSTDWCTSWCAIIWLYGVYTSQYKSCSPVLCLYDWWGYVRITTFSWGAWCGYVGWNYLHDADEEVTCSVSPEHEKSTFWEGKTRSTS